MVVGCILVYPFMTIVNIPFSYIAIYITRQNVNYPRISRSYITIIIENDFKNYLACL